ncbi:MAG: cysteine desulfurase [Lachnospiraceae bacterium]|nr:cysteine desulfurase [Lachnospiraceae bacterium]
MEAYLDNSATTRCFPQVAALMARVLTEDYGNPSSMHQKGVDGERYVRRAREIIAGNLKVQEKELYFTSGGTESDNLAIIGCALANHRSGKHLITSSVEHPAVLRAMEHLKELGFSVTYLPVGGDGRVRVTDLEAALQPDTILVSVMHVNNEIGAVQPIGEIGALLKAQDHPILFHVDAVQSYGKYRIYPKRLGIDLLSASGHKLHGPKGVGFLYVRDKVKIKPLVFGGGQQGGLRSGTENVPGIAGLGAAVEECYRELEEKMDRLYELRQLFCERVEELEGVTVNGLQGRESAPHVVSVSFAGVRSEVLLHALEERGIYVSAGSACSSNHPAVSATLKGIGVRKELLDSTLRFSFSVDTTREELSYTLQVLGELLPVLRRFTRH